MSLRVEASEVSALADHVRDTLIDPDAAALISLTTVVDTLRAVVPGHFGEDVVSSTSGSPTPFVGYSENRIIEWLDFGGELKPVGGRYNTQDRKPHMHSRYLYPALYGELQGISNSVAIELSNKI